MSQPEADPLVPIRGDRVAAALRWKELTVNSLATALGDNAQTLDLIVAGKTRRSRRSRRDRVAAHLGCPSEWLGGETELEGVVPQALLAGGTGRPGIVDEGGFMFSVTAAEGATGGSSAAYHLACWDVSNQIIAAWERDIREGVAEASQAKESLESPEWPEWGRVRQAVKWLLSGINWRRSLLRRPTMEELGPLSPEEISERLLMAEDFAVSQAKAFLAVLAPWLEGLRPVDYTELRVVLEYLLAGAITPSRAQAMFGEGSVGEAE